MKSGSATGVRKRLDRLVSDPWRESVSFGFECLLAFCEQSILKRFDKRKGDVIWNWIIV